MLTRSTAQPWNSIARLLKVVPNGCFQAFLQNIFALLSNNYSLPRTNFYLLALLPIMRPRRARISGNLTVFLTVKVTGYNTGGPYMPRSSWLVKSVVRSHCSCFYLKNWGTVNLWVMSSVLPVSWEAPVIDCCEEEAPKLDKCALGISNIQWWL